MRKAHKWQNIALGITLPLIFLINTSTVKATIKKSDDTLFCQGHTAHHALSLLGKPKYTSDFQAFDYVNHKAPKGGKTIIAGMGGFDSLNPFVIQGESAPGIGMIYDSLMRDSADDPSSKYGLLAEKVCHPSDYSWVEFLLRPEAKWHDKQPVTAQDVVFSFNLLREKGNPIYRYYYANVQTVTAVTPSIVRFTFDKTGNRELPVIIGQMVVLPKHFWQNRDFTNAGLTIPLGSGPYKVREAVANRRIVFERVTDYWGAHLPINQGHYNFDIIDYEMYRDGLVSFEAFKSGSYDFHQEYSAKNWANNYDFPALKKGQVTRLEIPFKLPQPMQALIFNLRRHKFQDIRVRKALTQTLDFAWMNKTLFFNAYHRTHSFFQGSELEAKALPSKEELAILKPFKDQLPSELFTKPFHPDAVPDATHHRMNLRQAKHWLRQAGWQVKKGVLHNAKGEPFKLEILVTNQALKRAIIPMLKNMEILGVQANIRMLEPAQYIRRLRQFDYDMVVASYSQSLSPGNEQREYWGTEAANRPGSRNYAGIQNPMVDQLIEKIIFADNRQTLVNTTKALDRVLQWGYYMIPQWHSPIVRIAYWQHLNHPKRLPDYGLAFPDIWWHKNATLLEAKKER